VVAVVLRGRMSTCQDITRRGSKRQKQVAHLARLLEAHSRWGLTDPTDIRQKFN
jgi:hypothetical protein